jgi:hypothetical protein
MLPSTPFNTESRPKLPCVCVVSDDYYTSIQQASKRMREVQRAATTDTRKPSWDFAGRRGEIKELLVALSLNTGTGRIDAVVSTHEMSDSGEMSYRQDKRMGKREVVPAQRGGNNTVRKQAAVGCMRACINLWALPASNQSGSYLGRPRVGTIEIIRDSAGLKYVLSTWPIGQC